MINIDAIHFSMLSLETSYLNYSMVPPIPRFTTKTTVIGPIVHSFRS